MEQEDKKLEPSFIMDMGEMGNYCQVTLRVDPESQQIKVTPHIKIPVDSVTTCDDLLAQVGDLVETYDFLKEKDLSDLPKGTARELILDRFLRKLIDLAELCDANHILIHQPEVIENTESTYGLRIHYMMMVKVKTD